MTTKQSVKLVVITLVSVLVVFAALFKGVFASVGGGQPSTLDHSLNGAQSQPQSINTDRYFNLLENNNHAKASVGLYHDSELDFIGVSNLSSYLGNQNHAIATEFNFGPRVFRVNTTYGLGLTPANRIKFTVDYLGERRDFMFYSGTVRRWVQQVAFAGDYTYTLARNYLNLLGIGGYVSYANSRGLSNKNYQDGGELYRNYRRIAGSNSQNVHFNIGSRLWPRSQFVGGLDYDAVHFKRRYQSDQNKYGLGGHVELTQLLLPQIKLNLQSQLRKTEYNHAAALNWLLPSPSHLQMELSTIFNYIDSRVADYHAYVTGLRFNINYGVSCRRKNCVYQLTEHDSQTSLLHWTQTPAVRMSHVLAITDQKRELISSGVSGAGGGPEITGSSEQSNPVRCPSTDEIHYDKNTGHYSPDNGWSVDRLAAGEPDKFFKASVSSGSGNSATCYYKAKNLSYANPIRLTYSKPLQPDLNSGNWGPDPVNGGHLCVSTNHPSECLFTTSTVSS